MDQKGKVSAFPLVVHQAPDQELKTGALALAWHQAIARVAGHLSFYRELGAIPACDPFRVLTFFFLPHLQGSYWDLTCTPIYNWLFFIVRISQTIQKTQYLCIISSYYSEFLFPLPISCLLLVLIATSCFVIYFIIL